jgi:hypothetical protein
VGGLDFMTLNEIHSKAWTHFDMIAKQRISNFNHYFIAIGVLLTASAAFGADHHHKTGLFVFSLFNIIAPVSFLFIDLRINRLLKNLKESLQNIESNPDWPILFRPFHRDSGEQVGLWHRITSYSGVFWTLFGLHILFGIYLTLHSFYFLGQSSIMQKEEKPEPLGERRSQDASTPTPQIDSRSFHFHLHLNKPEE